MYLKSSPLAILLMALPLVALQFGCESSDDADGSYWRADESASSPQAEGEAAVAGDAVPFGALNFCYGGFNGSGATYVPAEIHGLHVSGGSLSYSWGSSTLKSWGLSDGDHRGALACFFVQKSDGSWVGGKFDWISTSRTSRSLGHVTGGYGGWSLAGVPNPCPCAFVIVSEDGSKRSNVVASTWSR